MREPRGRGACPPDARACRTEAVHESGSSSCQHGLLEGLRQCDRSEKYLWIYVVVAGFVDDPQLAMLLRCRFAKRQVDFPLLERRGIAIIPYADDELLG